MKKYISSIISFIMAASIIATGSFADFTSDYTVTTVSEIVTDKIALDNDALNLGMTPNENIFSRVFGIEGHNKVRFLDKSPNNIAYAEGEDESDYKYVFINPNGGYIDANSTTSYIEMLTSTFDLTLSRVRISTDTDAPFPSGTKMTFAVTTGNNIVISASDDNLLDNHATITRVGPGIATVSVTIDDGNMQRTVTARIKVGFEIVKTGAEWEKVGIDGEKVLFIDQKKYISDPYYQLQILYLAEKNQPPNSDNIVLSPKSGNEYKEDVVTYESGGKLRIVGAGYTKITLQASTDPDQVQSFWVLVAPVGHEYNVGYKVPDLDENGDQKVDGFGNPIYKETITLDSYKQTYDLGMVNGDSFTIYSNAAKASNLSWKVYIVGKDESLTEIKENDKSRLTYDVSKHSNVVNFSNVTAGTYRIIGKASDTFVDSETRNYVQYDVVVLINPRVGKEIYINVGDTYDILANTNLTEDLFDKIYNISVKSLDGSASNNYITTSRYGLVTGVNVGDATVTLTYKGGSNNALFDTNKVKVDPIVYTFHVIDFLAINNSNLSSDGSANFIMYAGGKYPLYASVTNKDYDVYWESLDETIVKLEDNGSGSVMVSALKKGNVTVRAYQIINGVEKNAYCTITVKNTSTKITLDPAVAEVEVGDFKTVVAKFDGDAVDLTWVSSDENIFTFVDGVNVGKSATIEAVKPGTAILTAINPNNIVCGYCEVRVFQEVTGIRLSETDITLPEKEGHYQLYAYLEPTNASDSTVLWTSSDPSVVDVDENGKLEIKKEGTCTIIAQSVLNPEFFALCKVTILQGVDSIKLDKNKHEMYKGETYRLPYVINPKDASDDSIKINVFDTSVVQVTASEDHTLLIKANGVGTTTFMVMTNDGKYFDLCTVTVKQVATDVKMNYTKVSLNVGEAFDMDVSLTPADSTEASLTWTSIDPTIATVSQTGRIIGVKKGKTTVFCTTLNGRNSYCEVTVNEGAESITMDDEEITIDVGESYTIDVVFKPVGASNKNLKWSSLDPQIATVNDAGVVTGITGGHTVITAESSDGGFKSFCLVHVEEFVQSLTIDPEKYILGIGKSFNLTAVIKNEKTVSDPELIWYSDDEYIATVDQTGKITGIHYGKTVITVEAAKGDAKATCEIEVVKEVENIYLRHDSYQTLLVGNNFQLDPIVYPDDADYTDVLYTVVDENGEPDNRYAIVDKKGLVTGIKPGTTWVRIDAMDNSGIFALVYFKVIDPIHATGVTLSSTELVLLPGESKTVQYTLKPVDSTDKMIWTSKDEYVASVEDGVITGRNYGETTVKAMAESGKSTDIVVIVLGLSRTYIEMPIYTSYQLYVEGYTGTIRWDADDRSICDCNNGNIVTRKVGETIVYATINGRRIECRLKVTEK